MAEALPGSGSEMRPACFAKFSVTPTVVVADDQTLVRAGSES
jgi:hypothetical protein